jgi:Dynein heavy chain, N-terminal region 1
LGGGQAFDNCGTVATAFKLMETFEGLLERDIIASDLEAKHLQLLHNFRVELAEVALFFLTDTTWPVCVLLGFEPRLIRDLTNQKKIPRQSFELSAVYLR